MGKGKEKEHAEDRNVVIKLADEFSPTPGGRYRVHGNYSGEEFRERFLEPLFPGKGMVVVDLSGAYGYAPSFLEEAFGGMVRAAEDPAEVGDRLHFVCDDDPDSAVDASRFVAEQVVWSSDAAANSTAGDEVV